MSLTYKIAGNAFVQLLGKALTAGATFLITLFVARNYGAAGYGDFTKIITYIAVYYSLVSFGFNAVFIQWKNTTPFSFINLFFLRFFWSLVLSFIALSLLVFLPDGQLNNEGYTLSVKLGIIILVPTITLLGIHYSFNALFQKALRYDKSVLASVFGSAATLALVIVFITIKAAIPQLIMSYLFGGVVVAVLSYVLAKPMVSISKQLPNVSKHQMRKLFMFSVPLGITLIVNVIHFRVDIFVLTIFRTTQEVGIYGLSTKFFEFIIALPVFFMNAAYPVLVSKIQSKKPIQRTVKKSLIFLLTSSTILVVLGFLFAPLLSLIKEEFTLSVFPFRILIISLPLFFVSALYMWVLIALDKRWVLVRIYGAGMLFSVFFNLIFTPRLGYTAAAIITVVSEAFIVSLLIWYIKSNGLLRRTTKAASM